MAAVSNADFEKALEIGRPPNIVSLFPNSKALIVSGKAIDRAMIAKGKAMTIAANGRNQFVIRGALAAAQRANAAIIIEIAKSEGGAGAYCAVNFWNLARLVDSIANELGITVPVAIHADHYGIKGDADVEAARTEIPSMFDAGVTSIWIAKGVGVVRRADKYLRPQGNSVAYWQVRNVLLDCCHTTAGTNELPRRFVPPTPAQTQGRSMPSPPLD